MDHLNAQVDDAKVNEVMEDFRVERVKENGELMLEMRFQNEMAPKLGQAKVWKSLVCNDENNDSDTVSKISTDTENKLQNFKLGNCWTN